MGLFTSKKLDVLLAYFFASQDNQSLHNIAQRDVHFYQNNPISYRQDADDSNADTPNT